MKLWKVIIKTYYFDVRRNCELFISADTESNMLGIANSLPMVKKYEDAEIVSYAEINLTDKTKYEK